ncbi:hypothetical protein EDB19DRAFT_1646332 [Suillus lakei]|nr:hypothetical protein EDB19DRAFT_1646332 [Suillus lakei]
MQGNDQFDSWELFPYSLQTLAKWADVYQDHARPDKSRDRILIYKNLLDAKPGEVYPVAIRLQGLLQQFHIDRFGNWSGRQSAHSISLVNMSAEAQLTMREQHDKPQKFKEVQGSSRKFKEAVLTEAQDPEGKYQHVQELWNVACPLTTANLTGSGKILPMDSVLLSEGDFVDVGAELDFVVSRDRHKGTTLKCFLTCTHIVRLIPADYVQHMKLVSMNNT